MHFCVTVRLVLAEIDVSILLLNIRLIADELCCSTFFELSYGVFTARPYHGDPKNNNDSVRH